MNELIENVRQWGEDKGITGPNGTGTLLRQLEKTQEELTETRDAAVRLNCMRGELDRAIVKNDLIDGIGDTLVTLILAAELAGVTIGECLRAAYAEISNRTGKMVGGQFVKDAADDDDDWEELDAGKACRLGDETCESCQ